MRTLITALVLLTCAAPALADGGRWREDLTHRPRLAFDGRDPAHIARLVARIDAQQDPWATGYRALRDLAEGGQPKDHRGSGWQSKGDKWEALYSQEAQNGAIAAAKTAVAWLYTRGLDPAWRPLPRLPGEATPEGWCRAQTAEARRIIEAMYDDWPGWRGFGVLNRGIVMADSLTMHCLAYDLLEALPPSWHGALAKSRERLSDLASDARYYWKIIDSYDGNHPMRVASGLGIAAIALNDLDRYRWWKPGTWWHRPSGWVEKAERNLHPTRRGSDLRGQASQGAFAEGSSYYAYALDLVLPFCFSYARFQGQGRGVPFLQSDLMNELLRWSVDTRLPDGRRPQVDNARMFHDSGPAYFLSRLRQGARGDADREVLLWDLKHSGFPGFGGRRALFQLGAYDPDPALEARVAAWTGLPGTPSRYLDRQGAAVLRTGWGADAAHVLVQAQHGELRTAGGGHESVDNGSYALWMHGDVVTLDPGYYGFTKVEATNAGQHRSLVLVDGEAARPAHHWFLGLGPWVSGGVDTHIVAGERSQVRGEVRPVAVRSRYCKADIDRTVALVGARYLVVEDRCASKKARTFTTQVQTNAGAPKQRPLTRAGAVVRYETNRGRVQVCVGASASAALSARTSRRESWIGEGPDGHEAIEYSARGAQVRFLTAIAAAPPGAAAPEVEAIALPNGAVALRVASGGAVDVIVSSPSGAVAVPATSGTAAFRSTHALTIVSFPQNGQRSVLWTVGPGAVSF
ncbi:MAG: heparinase II/III family protein [Planctomycetota bacterium]